jgi:hypothetical protein
MATSEIRWTAKRWVENEIEDVADSYGQTDDRAAIHVQELLNEGEYRDELTDDQVEKALAYIRGRESK